MKIKTEAEAQKLADELLAKMTGRGWETRVWNNLGWFYALKHPSGLSIHVGAKPDQIWASLAEDGVGDLSIWHKENKPYYSDPNEAARDKVADAWAVVVELKKLVEETHEAL